MCLVQYLYWEVWGNKRPPLKCEDCPCNCSEKPNNCKDEPQIEYCDTCRFEDYSSSKEPCNSCLVDGSKWQPKDEPTISKMEQVEDEPQTDCPRG